MMALRRFYLFELNYFCSFITIVIYVRICCGEQYLPHVVPLAFASCNLDDGSAVDIDEADDENINGFGGVSSDDEAHYEPRVCNISVRTGVLDEKAAATQALGLFAQHTKTSYAPYPLGIMCILFLLSPFNAMVNKLIFHLEFFNCFKLFGGVIKDFNEAFQLFS